MKTLKAELYVREKSYHLIDDKRIDESVLLDRMKEIYFEMNERAQEINEQRGKKNTSAQSYEIIITIGSVD